VIFVENKEKRRGRQPCPEARTDSAPTVENCDDKNKKGERAGENVAATAAASVSASVRRARNSVQKLCAPTTTRSVVRARSSCTFFFRRWTTFVFLFGIFRLPPPSENFGQSPSIYRKLCSRP